MAAKHNLQKLFVVTFMICYSAAEANPDKSPKYPVTSPRPARGSLMYASPTSHDLIDEDFLRRTSITIPQPRKIIISHAKRKTSGIGRPRALLPPGQKRRRRIFNMMKNKLSKHKVSATHVLARKMIQKLKEVKSPEPPPNQDVSRSLLLNTSMPEAEKVKTTSWKPITKSPPVYKPGPAIIKFAPDKEDFIKAGLLKNVTQNIERKSNKKKMDKFITTYRPNFLFKQLDKMPKKLKDMEGMSLYVETAYSPVYTNHPLANPKFLRNEPVFRKYNISNKHKSQNDRSLHKTPNYHTQIQERNGLYPEYRKSPSPTASSYIPPIPPKAILHPLQHVPLPSPNTYKLNNIQHPNIQLPHHLSQTPTPLPGHQPVLLRNVHPSYLSYKPPQEVPPHVYYSQPSRGYHLTKDPYQQNSYPPVPRSSFEIIPTHFGYSNPFQPTSHKPVYKKVKGYTANKSKQIPKYSITFPDDRKPSYPNYQSNIYSNISLSSKVKNKPFSHIRPISKPKYVRENSVYNIQPETTTISSKNYLISDKSTKSSLKSDYTTSSPYNYRLTTEQPALVQSSTSYPYSVSLEGAKHYKISKSKKVNHRILGVGPGSALKKSLKEYPVHNGIPRTPFSCVGKVTGYYADLDAKCQVFHMCQFRGHKSSFLCPNGTLFNQRILTCDHHRNVNCENSYKHYQVNKKIFKTKRMINKKNLKDLAITISNYEDINNENDIFGSLERPEDLQVKYSILKKASYPTTQPSFSIESKRSTVSTSKSVKAKPSVATTTSNYEDRNNINVNRIGIPVTQPHTIYIPNSSQETEYNPSLQTEQHTNAQSKPSSQTAQNAQAQDQPSSTEIMKLVPVIRSTQPHIINPVKVQPYVP